MNRDFILNVLMHSPIYLWNKGPNMKNKTTANQPNAAKSIAPDFASRISKYFQMAYIIVAFTGYL